MKDEKDLQAKDRLLNLFIDGEMTSDKAADYRAEVLAKDPQAQAEHQSLLNIRREIRDYNAERTAEVLAQVKTEQLWQRIEREIDREEKVSLPWWRAFSIPAFSLAAACAVIAFALGTQFGNTNNSPNGDLYAAANKLENSTVSSAAMNTNVTSAGDNFEFKLSSHENGANHEILVAANQEGLLHRVPIELDSEQLIGVDRSIPFRSNGIDIDWIKSDRQYRIVPSGKAVPVIWVSGNK